MKRFISLILCLCLVMGGLISARAEDASDDVEFTEDELAEMEEEQREAEEDVEVVVEGEVYHEKTREDFSLDSPAPYTAKLRKEYSIFAEKDTESKKLYASNGHEVKIDILYVGLRWMIVRKDNVIGYVKREYVAKSTVQTVDPVNTPPFNVQKHQYIARTATTCHVRKSMVPSNGSGDDGNNYVILKPGTELYGSVESAFEDVTAYVYEKDGREGAFTKDCPPDSSWYVL